MEQTWNAWPGTDAWKDYEWSLGPLRPKVEAERKKSFWLAMSVWGGGDSSKSSRSGGREGGGEGGSKGGKEDLTQVYLHRGEEGEVDEAVELVWLAAWLFHVWWLGGRFGGWIWALFLEVWK